MFNHNQGLIVDARHAALMFVKRVDQLIAGASPGPPRASDDGDQRTVTDPAASGTKKFYTVEIVKP